MTVRRARVVWLAAFVSAALLPPLGALTAAVAGQGPLAPFPPFEFRYHRDEESTALLKSYVARFPQLAKLYSIGKSATGKRELWCIEIGNQQTGPAEEKPATYVDGSQHATDVVGGETTLHLAYYLLAHYGTDPAVTRLVDTRVTYILQRADPDGAEAYLTGKIDWPSAITPGASDRDGDGTIGEDAAEDVDGDGEILKYRIPDPNGRWKKYAGDPRVMARRVPEDREGPFYTVIDEGIDNDGDGKVNEDAPYDFTHTFVSNRNYPAYWASGDGRLWGDLEYPLQEHNTRLIRLARPVELGLDLPPGARTADPRTVTFPFLRGMRGSAFETPYDVTWRVEAPAGARLTVVLRSDQAGTDRRTVVLGGSTPGPAPGVTDRMTGHDRLVAMTSRR